MPADPLPSRMSATRKLLLKHIVKKVFFEDWHLKLIALAITFGLWLGVTGLSTPEKKNLTLPLVPNIYNNVEITSALRPEVTVTVSGDKRKIDQLNSRGDLVASLDLTEAAPGERDISLTPANVAVELPQGVKIVEITPSFIHIKIEAVQEKDVDVQAQMAGSPTSGFEVYRATSLPPKVRVRGPTSFVEPLNSLQTDKIDLTGRKADFTAHQVPVIVSNPNATVLNTVVDVFLRIGERRVERTFNIPIADQPGQSARVTLYGPRTLLSKMRADVISVDTSTDATGELAPSVILPPDVEQVVEIRKVAIRK
jgi:YbbR-like protein